MISNVNIQELSKFIDREVSSIAQRQIFQTPSHQLIVNASLVSEVTDLILRILRDDLLIYLQACTQETRRHSTQWFENHQRIAYPIPCSTWSQWDILTPGLCSGAWVHFLTSLIAVGLIFISVRLREWSQPFQLLQMMPWISDVFPPSLYLPFRWLLRQLPNHQAPSSIWAQLCMERSWSRSLVENHLPLWR